MPHRFIQAIVLLFVLGSLAFTQKPDGLLHIFFLETAGDAVLVQTPHGKHVLVDGGADPTALASALGQRLPFWKRTLDAVILTLPDSKHVPGQIGALARYTTPTAFVSAHVPKNAATAEWQQLLHKANTPTHTLRNGMRFRIDGVDFDVLEAGSKNGGTVLRLQWGATTAVLAHTINQTAETTLAATNELRRADVIAYPWERDPNNAFVAALSPRAIVFSDGVSEDQPAELTMAQRAVGGATTYHERLHGTIEWRSDGKHATVVVSRNYCASSSSWNERLWASVQSVSASCNNRVRS